LMGKGGEGPGGKKGKPGGRKNCTKETGVRVEGEKCDSISPKNPKRHPGETSTDGTGKPKEKKTGRTFPQRLRSLFAPPRKKGGKKPKGDRREGGGGRTKVQRVREGEKKGKDFSPLRKAVCAKK